MLKIKNMNRIIIVGNGFDLAHGVKTSYKNFIDWYLGNVIECLKNKKDELCGCEELIDSKKEAILLYEDKLLKLIWGGSCQGAIMVIDKIINEVKHESVESHIAVMKKEYGVLKKELSPLFERIIKDYENKGWVDIETDYYEMLKDYALKGKGEVKQLNEELSYIEKKLVKYLTEVEKKYLSPNPLDNSKMQKDFEKNFKNIIYEPIAIKDISCKGESSIIKHIEEECLKHKGKLLSVKLEKYKVLENQREYALSYVKKLLNSSKEYSSLSEVPILNLIETELLIKQEGFPKELLFPNGIMLLNFNYTEVADKYLDSGFVYEIVHIHGKLDDKDSVIFGYGDELDKNYKEIEELNDNECLEKVKSVKYLERDNYRKLLHYIDLEPFQVYIMGHSCGNSDRTLLNTIFEHENCVSIKPFYYKYEDKEGNERDNYTEIVQNITRNFNDKKLLRDRVVNKMLCEPMPQSEIGCV